MGRRKTKSCISLLKKYYFKISLQNIKTLSKKVKVSFQFLFMKAVFSILNPLYLICLHTRKK